MRKEREQRVIWADFLRVFAILAVIIQHYTPAILDAEIDSFLSFEWGVANFYACLCNFCVPVFIMISGAFLLDPSKKKTTKDLFSKNISKILILIVFWGILYGIIKHLFFSEASFTIFSIIGPLFYKRFPWYHLWFLYLILALYLLTPLLRVYTQHASRKNIEYLLLLFFFISCIKAWNFLMPNLNFNIIELTGYVGYYVAGYYLSKYSFTRKTTHLIYIVGLLSFVLSFILTFVFSIKNGTREPFFIDNIIPTTILFSYAVFLFVKNQVSQIRNAMFIKTIRFLASYVLGVYLIHDLFIQLFRLIGFTVNSFSVIGSIPILGITTFGLSVVSVVLIKKIPFFGKYIV